MGRDSWANCSIVNIHSREGARPLFCCYFLYQDRFQTKRAKGGQREKCVYLLADYLFTLKCQELGSLLATLESKTNMVSACMKLVLW